MRCTCARPICAKQSVLVEIYKCAAIVLAFQCTDTGYTVHLKWIFPKTLVFFSTEEIPESGSIQFSSKQFIFHRENLVIFPATVFRNGLKFPFEDQITNDGMAFHGFYHFSGISTYYEIFDNNSNYAIIWSGHMKWLNASKFHPKWSKQIHAFASIRIQPNAMTINWNRWLNWLLLN